MTTTSGLLKYSAIAILIFSIFFIATGRCQDDDEDDEDTYYEEIGDESTTTRRSRTRSSTTATVTTPASASASRTNGSSTVRTAGTPTRSATVEVPTPASAPAPSPTRATVRTTTISEYEDDEVTTEEEGYGYVFRPLNNLIDNIVAGNVTGIVDNALSIRTPPEIRAFVNNVMANVFGAGIGNALKQFMPNLFSTQAPPVAGSNERDPIPTQRPISGPPPQTAIIQDKIPTPQVQAQAVITGRNSTDEVKSAKTKQPVQLQFTHPGAPASRLRCEVIM